MKHIQTYESFLNESSDWYDKALSTEEVVKSITNHKMTASQNKLLNSMLPEEKAFVKEWIDLIAKTTQSLDNSDKSMDWQKFDKVLFDARGDKPMINGMDARHVFLGKQKFSSWLDDLLTFVKGALYIPGKQIGRWNHDVAAYVLTIGDLGYEEQLKQNNHDVYTTWENMAANLGRKGCDENREEWENDIEKEEESSKGNTIVKMFDKFAPHLKSRTRNNNDTVSRL